VPGDVIRPAFERVVGDAFQTDPDGVAAQPFLVPRDRKADLSEVAARDRWLQDRGESLGGHPEAEQDDEECSEFWHPTKAAANEAVPVRGALCKAACADQHEPDSHECHRHAETEGKDEHHAEPDPVEVDRAEEQ